MTRAMTKTFSFNWRLVPSYYWFLATFLKPREPDDRWQGVDWPRALGESPAWVIELFQVQGVLTRASLPVRMDLLCTRNQLAEMCRSREESASGSKDVLIQRLIEADFVGVSSAVSEDVFQCTDVGRSLAEKYLSDPESVLQDVEQMAEDEEIDAPEERMTKKDVQRIARWLAAEGIVLGVVGNAAYDVLKGIVEAAGEKMSDYISSSPAPMKETYVTSRLKLEWCFVPAGSFLMGSSDRDPHAKENEKPQHRVHVNAYYLGKYPITNEQYAVFVKATGHREPYGWEDGRFPQEKYNHPVVNVSWTDAVAFCEWAARLSHLPIRLPTEAEWEKGARGTDGRIYPWSNSWRSGVCNTEEMNIGGTTAVNRFPQGRSPYGAFDMIGNVWEWTSSLYKDYPYRANDGREQHDEQAGHVVRGGAWYWESSSARAACRGRYIDHWDYVIGYGFRVCVAAPFF